MLTFNLSTQSTQGVTPFADVYDLEDKILVFADMPGVSQETLDLHVVDNRLTIHGRYFSSVDGIRLVRECPRCDYYRVIKLSRTIAAERIVAQMKDGVLTLTLPKKQAGKSFEVPISLED